VFYNVVMDPRQLAALAALDDPTRRAVFDLVARSATAVSRDAAAEALGTSRRVAAFHLDRLAEQGLLTVEYRRPAGRTGPGAGRPAKLYRRIEEEVAPEPPTWTITLTTANVSDPIPRFIVGTHNPDDDLVGW